MRELGYVEGKDFVSEWRSADSKYERLPELAVELVRLKMDIIVSALTAGVRALQQATDTIPIVIVGATDPVGNGFARPVWRAREAISPAYQVPRMTPLRSNWSCWRRLWRALRASRFSAIRIA
jgi:hypothetical protein